MTVRVHRPPHGVRLCLILLIMAGCMLMQFCRAAPTIVDPAKFLERAEGLRLQDHPRFLQMLEQIRHEAPPLSDDEQWHLHYLQAWEDGFEGKYADAEAELHQIIDHSGDPALATKASAVLLNVLSFNRRYEDAFVLANRLAATLPQVKDPQTRFTLLTTLSQTVDFADQVDLAVQYARMAEDAIPPGETPCRPLSLEVAALYNGKRLTTSNPQLRRAIDTCNNARQPVLADAMWLVLDDLYLEGNEPSKALALLDRIEPAIQASRFYVHLMSFQVKRARAYLELGDDKEAKRAALAAVAMSHPNDGSERLMEDYQLLYQIEKKQGHDAAALAYHERYSALEKSHLDDVHARALAYDVAEQHLLAQKMQAQGLSKQNSILKLQQALASKAVETSRLYIALLLLVLATVVVWLFRLKRSQLRFKQLSSLDGLTGIFNYQHFTHEAERVLRMLEKKRGSACLIAIDLDHFKQINDTHGHALGDTVLKRTVAICRHQLRANDLFGRLGGEEFCVLLVDCQRDQGMAIADCIRAAMAATLIDVDGGVVSFSASLGVACTDTSGYELQRLCKEADAALYKAKRTGRNRVVVSDESADQGHAEHAGKRASQV